MEDVDEDYGIYPGYPRNTSPINPSRVLELNDGTDDDEDSCPALIPREDNGDDSNEDDGDDEDDDDDGEQPEESAEAELGQ
jgi:hypothetical protein